MSYVYGKAVREPVKDVTPTYLTVNVFATLLNDDHVASKVLSETGCIRLRSSPFVSIAVHFDRNSSQRIPSCQGSIVFRQFLSQDFVTGMSVVFNIHLKEVIVALLRSNFVK